MKKTTYIEFKEEEIKEILRQHLLDIKTCPEFTDFTFRIDYDNEEDSEPYGKFVGITAIIREESPKKEAVPNG